MGACSDLANGHRRWHEAGKQHVPPTDVRIVTSDGQGIPAHSSVLASSSPVIGIMLDRSRQTRSNEKIIHILGAPHDAVLTFVQFLYSRASLSSSGVELAMEKHAMPLLVMSHAYRVRWLKRLCEAGVAMRLSAANVIDALKMAKLCDAPCLHQLCMRVLSKDFAAVQQTDGWRFAHKHDPALVQEVVRLVQQSEQRKKRWKRERADQEMYRQLSDEMDYLQHIFSDDGYSVIGHQKIQRLSKGRGPCSSSGLQHLIRHYANCSKELVPKKCTHCKRMWQLFRLHSFICDQSDSCKVPFCEQFKLKMETQNKVDETWRLLVKKVVTAKVMSSLARRKAPELVQKSWLRHRGSK